MLSQLYYSKTELKVVPIFSYNDSITMRCCIVNGWLNEFAFLSVRLSQGLELSEALTILKCSFVLKCDRKLFEIMRTLVVGAF